MNERMRALLKPGNVTKEKDLAEAVGWWKKEMREVIEHRLIITINFGYK